MTWCPKCKRWRKTNECEGRVVLVRGKPRPMMRCGERDCRALFIPDGKKSTALAA